MTSLFNLMTCCQLFLFPLGRSESDTQRQCICIAIRLSRHATSLLILCLMKNWGPPVVEVTKLNDKIYQTLQGRKFLNTTVNYITKTDQIWYIFSDSERRSPQPFYIIQQGQLNERELQVFSDDNNNSAQYFLDYIISYN